MNRVTRSARATSNRCLESPEIVSLLFDTGLLIDAVACEAQRSNHVTIRTPNRAGGPNDDLSLAKGTWLAFGQRTAPSAPGSSSAVEYAVDTPACRIIFPERR